MTKWITTTIERGALDEVDAFTFIAEASTLGFKPGEWPIVIQCGTPFGNEQPLARGRRLQCGGFVYRQLNGCIEVHVLND